MNILNSQAAASAASLAPPRRVGAPAPPSASRSDFRDGQKFSEAVASMESGGEPKSRAASDADDIERTKKRAASDCSGIASPAPPVLNALPAAPEEPCTAAANSVERSGIGGALVSPSGTGAASAAASLPVESRAQIPQETRPEEFCGAQTSHSLKALPSGMALETPAAPANRHSADVDIHSSDPESGLSKETSNSPSGARAIGADTIGQPGNIRDASAISSPLPSSDLNTLADAFECSIRNFEQSGQNWSGRASFTLQSSVLQGASFQLTSDGRSLCIQLTQMAAAAVPISRREENELSSILTRKLGREVSLNLGLSEIAASEETEYAENNDD